MWQCGQMAGVVIQHGREMHHSLASEAALRQCNMSQPVRVVRQPAQYTNSTYKTQTMAWRHKYTMNKTKSDSWLMKVILAKYWLAYYVICAVAQSFCRFLTRRQTRFYRLSWLSVFFSECMVLHRFSAQPAYISCIRLESSHAQCR